MLKMIVAVSALVMGVVNVLYANTTLGKGATAFLDGRVFPLEGKNLKVGDRFPNLTLNSHDGIEYAFKNGKTGLVVIVLPKLGTPVCDGQVESISAYLNGYKGPEVDFVIVSNDSVEEQAVYKQSHELSPKLKLVSAKGSSFGIDTGTRMQDSALLARTVFYVSSEGEIGKVSRLEDLGQSPSVPDEMAELLGAGCGCSAK